MPQSRLDQIHAQLAIPRAMQVRREEYLDHMTFRANVRPLFTEILGPMVRLQAEWKAQGAAAGELDFSAFRYRQAVAWDVPVATGWIGGPPEEVLHESAEAIVARDRMGRRIRLLKGYASMGLPMDYPVRTWDDWRRLKAHYAFSEERFQPGWAEGALRAREQGYVVTVSIPGGFDEPRQLLGAERLCTAYHDEPDLVRDILATIGDTARKVLDRVSATVAVDQLLVHEDMAGHAGPLAGPRQVRDFIAPYYRPIWEMLRDRGARLFALDSDGFVAPIIPAMLDAGVNVMWPMEPSAGMDIVEVRKQYGTRLATIGGIDKHVLLRTRDEIEAELEYKIPPMVRTGGCVLGLDHRVPNGTPLANYRFYIEKAWRIMDREADALPR